VNAIALRRIGPRSPALVTLGIVVVVAGISVGVVWAMEHATYDTVAGVLIGIGLGLLSLVAMMNLSKKEDDARVARLLLVAPLLKLGATVLRFAVAFVVYDGSADSAIYHDQGIRLREFYIQGIFNPDLEKPFVGAGFIRAATGFLYTLTGPTQLGAYFVFSWIGFWGLYLFYRAFRMAVPEGDGHRYALLVLLLPSLLFWPSSLGKEAWMTLGLGLIAYGAARVLTLAGRGFVIVAGGVLVTGVVRPHVAAMAVIALVVAYMFRRQPRGSSITAPLGKVLGLLALGLALVLIVGQTKSLLGIDDFNADAVQSAREEVVHRTSKDAGSAFTTADSDLNASSFPAALMSVLFRPFPWEATNVQSAIAALEGLVLVGLFVAGWRRLLSAFRSVVSTPYIVMCITYIVLFTYGFSSFSNFGILTRQRVQVLPFILVLLALPPYRGRVRDVHALLLGETATPPPT
jgi:hypothetical protein